MMAAQASRHARLNEAFESAIPNARVTWQAGKTGLALKAERLYALAVIDRAMVSAFRKENRLNRFQS